MNLEVLILVILSSLFGPSKQRVIIVDGINGNDTLCNRNISYSCKALHAGLKAVKDGDTIQICDGNYSYNTNIALISNDVTITGSGSGGTVIECNNGTGFGFINVTNITISRLTLSGCGKLRNSSTMNISSNAAMLFRAALYFVNVTTVVIDSIVISNSIGMGVAMYDVIGNVTVTNSTFRNNSVPSYELNVYPGGGGFSVEFSYCKPLGGISSSCYNTNKGASSCFTAAPLTTTLLLL